MENSSPIKKTIKDIYHYAPAKIIPGFLGLLAIIIYTRFLTPKEYGLYTLAISTISIVLMTCFEWLNKSILRYFERYRQEQCLSVFISTIIISLVGIIIIILVLWYIGINLFRSKLDPDFVVLLNVGGGVILTQAGYTFILFIRQTSQESFKYAIRSVVNAVVTLTLSVCFLCFFHTGPKGILWGMVISAGSVFIWDFFSFRRRWDIKISYFSKKLFKTFLTYGFPLIEVSVASLILVVVDRYMIQYFLTTNEVGVYSAGYNLANAVIQFPMAVLLLAAYPIIIETFEKKKKEETSLLLNKLIAMYFLFLTPIVFGMAVLAKDITNILLGEGFEGSYIILPWVSAGAFCFGLTQYFYKPFELKEKTKILSLLVSCAALFNIILNLFFIPKFGILGAAYSTLISYIVYLLITWLISRKIFIWSFPWQTIAKTLFASVVMYLFVYSIRSAQHRSMILLILNVILGMACYLIILLLIRERFVLQGFQCILNYFKEKTRSAA